MLAVLGNSGPHHPASNQGLAVQAAAGSRAPQTDQDAAGSYKIAGYLASPPALQILQSPAPCCSLHSGQQVLTAAGFV